MIGDLWWIALVESALVGWVGLIAGLRGWHWVHTERRLLPRRRQAQTEMTRHLLGESAGTTLAELPYEAQCALLMQLATSLSGEARQSLVEEARRGGHLAREGRQLRSWRWWVRLRAVRFFSALGVVPEVLDQLLVDPEPLVRAEAILLVATQPTPPRVDNVVRELFGPASLARYASQMVLPQLGLAASQSLVRQLESPPGPPAVALRSAAAVASAELLPAALRFSAAPDPAVRAAAVHLLAAIGGSQSAARLVELLDDPIRAEAAAALGHLSHWQAAPQLARLLTDSEWQVRYQCALALHRFGPPGRLFLRQASQSTHPEAASIVRYVTDLDE